MLLVELEGHSNLAAPFGVSTLSYNDLVVGELEGGGRLRARQINPDDALVEYLDRAGLGPITRLARRGVVEVVAAAAPGIRDLVALGKIRQLEQRADAELIVVDAPAAGHAMTFLQAPLGLARSSPSGPVRRQADLVLEMFADERRCRVLLVTLPEEMPVTETIETAYQLEDRVGIRLGPVVINSRWPSIEGLDEALAAAPGGNEPTVTERAASYRLSHLSSQAAEVERLGRELPLRQIELPFLFSTAIDRRHLDTLADAVVAQLDRPAP